MPLPSAMTGLPQWGVMWALAAAVFALCKWLTWRFTPQPVAPAWRHLAYLFLWPGLDPKAFLDPRPLPREKQAGVEEWVLALAKVAFGAALVWGVSQQVPPELPLLRGWVGMAGLVFLLHFGFFHVLSCCWRAAGVDAKPLMNWPILSQSLSEFWSKRWNLAFRDLTHRFVFRPFAARGKARTGVFAVFLLSGLVHDLVISLPAGGGYGLPTLYFVIQWLGLLAEKAKLGKRLGFGGGWRGRLFTAVVLIAPAYGLFHPPFVRGVIVPFLEVLGAG